LAQRQPEGGAATDSKSKAIRIRSAAILAIGLALAYATFPIEVQPAQIQRGEYLARVGDCISCHTASGGEPFAGRGRLNMPFGYMRASTITPNETIRIGLWSSGDFYRAPHDGVDRAGEDMYPTMPYDFYSKVTRAYMDAIYADLRTVACGSSSESSPQKKSFARAVP
jgi:mono/diheme cytochrome c family protein